MNIKHQNISENTTSDLMTSKVVSPSVGAETETVAIQCY